MAEPEPLNPRQWEAVRAAEGAVAVAAGPGTGKTRTLAYRIAHLVRELGQAPASILAVTFTRSAAEELLRRTESLLGDPAGLWVGTFHSVALRLLRQEGYPFGPGTEFAVASEEERVAALEGLVEPREAARFLEEVRLAKQALKAPPSDRAAEYQRRLAAARRLDFDDLLLHACDLLAEEEEVRARWRGALRHVMVDEFQDTSPAQYELLRRLAGENVCAIGDPDQAIYGFAGGGFRPFERFLRDHPGCRVISLDENYRSQATILEAARQVIGKNRAELPRELKARLERGLPIEISGHVSDRQEAEMIARRVEGLLGGASQFTVDSRWAEKEAESLSYGLGDIAILYRFHAQARRLEEALGRAGLPFRTFGPKRAEEAQPGGDLEDYRAAEPPPKGEWITLMTLHRSKGLEFPAVFLAGCEDGVLPFDKGDREEERRLFYVGMTRAKRRLFLSYAKRRMLFGRSLAAGPSPFVLDIEEALRTIREPGADGRRRSPKAIQPTLFDL